MKDMKDMQIKGFVDACDREEKWYAAQVTQIPNTEDVHVHFLSWRKQFDEIIPADEVTTRIATLFSYTLDRRSWKVGDTIEYQCCVDNPVPVWVEVSVIRMDLCNEKVQIELPSKDIYAGLLKMDCPTTTAKISKTEEWYYLLSDDIAPLGTHIKNAQSDERHIPMFQSISPPFATATTEDVSPVSAPLPTSLTNTWMASYLRARAMSAANIALCERVFVKEQGLTDTALFAHLSLEDLTLCMTEGGITVRGVRMAVLELHQYVKWREGWRSIMPVFCGLALMVVFVIFVIVFVIMNQRR